MLSVVGFFGREFDSPRLHQFAYASACRLGLGVPDLCAVG